ncbi:hypothetical protein Pint_00560 [Pistacia integerrima]|uniref:Uncharacterized protein n=1 Tax=Pistacia integerrima TaxID=434235 RepID=A0ACC0ZNY3_9ROSI|nr:hypothetical protein Pint_00560 [Pistacia integerrima]
MILEGCIQEDEALKEIGGINMAREIPEAIIGAHEVVALIDSGSTHNFISDRVAEMLHLPMKPTESFTVRIANGERLSFKGKYEKLLVDLQGNEFQLDFFSLPLTGLDMVLGIQWLETLGSVVCDWKKLTMDFIWEQQPKKL